MVDKKDKPTKSADKNTPEKKEADKVSLEELKKKREEVLKKINAEIGEEEDVEEQIEEKEEEKKEEDKESEGSEDKTPPKNKKDLEKDILAEDKEEESSEEKESEEPEKEKKKEVADDEEGDSDDDSDDDNDNENESEDEDKEKTKEDNVYSSPFSAKEFGLADSNKKSKNLILFLVVFAIVAILSAAAFYLYSTGVISVPQEEKITPTPTEAPSPTPTPVVFDREEISIQVLNGSGTAGVAGDMQDFLEEAGYADIEVGNAEDFDYENITIQLTEEYEEFFDEISSDIEEGYIVNNEAESLDEDSEYDTVIIVGTEVEESEESDE